MSSDYGEAKAVVPPAQPAPNDDGKAEAEAQPPAGDGAARSVTLRTISDRLNT